MKVKELSKEEFDNFKSFIEEKELSRKLGIAELIHENEFSAVDPSGYYIISNYASKITLSKITKEVANINSSKPYLIYKF